MTTDLDHVEGQDGQGHRHSGDLPHGRPPQDRTGVGRPDGAAPAARGPRGRERQLDRHPGPARRLLGAADRRQRGRGAGVLGAARARPDRDCTVLKLAHHGSRNGTDARWLSSSGPDLAVASLGATNDLVTLTPRRCRCCPAGDPAAPHRSGRHGHGGQRWQAVVDRDPPPPHSWPTERGRPGRRGRSSAAAWGGSKHPDRPIDLNSASQAELEGLPGVGPVLGRGGSSRPAYR